MTACKLILDIKRMLNTLLRMRKKPMQKANKYSDSMNWPDFVLMSDSYLKSAKVIYESDSIKDDKSLVVPMIYLLKHSIELSFKKLLKFNFNVKAKKIYNHDLIKLKGIFLNKLLIFWKENEGSQGNWDSTISDRRGTKITLEDFVKNFEKIISEFLEKSGFVENDNLNQEQRFPYGEYSEPTDKIISLFFEEKDRLFELANKITLDIDIVWDYIMRTQKSIERS